MAEDTTQVLSLLHKADSTLATSTDTLTPQTKNIDSTRRNVKLNLDSLSHTITRDTTIAVSNARALADSTQKDTLRRKTGIESPVDYTAKDSLVYDATTGFAHLYGDAQVQ